MTYLMVGPLGGERPVLAREVERLRYRRNGLLRLAECMGRARLTRSDGMKDFRPGSSLGSRDVVARHFHAMIVSADRWETSRRCKAASVRLRLSRDR